MNPSQNDSFGSFSNGQGGFGGYSSGQQVFSPMPDAVNSGGDIMMGGRKSRKWLVILIVVLLFVAVAGGVFAVWKSGIMGGGENGDSLVYEYVNLLVSGKDSEEKVDDEVEVDTLINGEENVQNIYTSLRMFSYNSEENVSYYKALKNALTKIEDVENTNEDWKEIVFLASNSKELLSRYFVATFLSDTNASYNYFLKRGNFDGFLLEYDFPFAESKEVFLQDFDVLVNGLFDAKKKMYEEISKTNCWGSDGIDYGCLELVSSLEIESTQLDNIELGVAVNDMVTNLLDLIAINANSMIKLVDGEYDA